MTQRIVLGERAVDLERGIVEGPSGSARLTSTERDVLRYLVDHPGPVSRDTLHSEVWGHGPTVLSRALDTTIRRLRKKLGEPARAPLYLLTVHGVGYELVGVDSTNAPPSATSVEEVLALVGELDATTPRGVPAMWLAEREGLAAAAERLLAQGRTPEAARLATAWLRVRRRVDPEPTAVALADQILAIEVAVESRVLLEIAAAALEGLEGADRIRRARRAAGSGSRELRVRALLATVRGEDPEPATREAVAIARDGVASPVLAQALGRLATVLHVTAPDESQALFLEALDHAQRSGARWEEAVISGNFAGLLRRLGALDAAEARYLHTIDVMAAWGDPWSERITWMSLATLRHQRLDLDGAEVAYRRALALAEPGASAAYRARMQVNLDGLALDRGDVPDPLGMDETLRTLRQQGEREYESICLCNQGVAWSRMAQRTLARTALERAVVVGREAGLTHHLHEYRGELATLDRLDGQTTDAIEGIEAAIAGLATTPTRQSSRARLLLRWAAWCAEDAVAFPEAALLTALAKDLPAVPGTAWEGLAAWR